MNIAAHAPFEIKSDPDNENEAETVTKALGAFRAAVDDRLAALETKAALDAKTADNKLADRLKALEIRLNRPGTGVELKSGNDNGEFERKAFVNYMRSGVERMPADEAKALTVATGATAGYLAPVQFGAELIKLLVQYSPIRAYAKTVQISAPEIIYPRRTALLAAQWVAEIDPRAASAPAFEQLTLTPYELAVYVDVSNQLLEDNIYDLEGEVTQEFAQTFGVVEGAAFVDGNGVGKPTGLMVSTQIASMPSLVAAKIGLDDIVAMYHALPSIHAQNAVWVMNRTTLGTLRSIKDTIGRPLLIDPVTSGAATTLLGRPIVEALDFANIATGASPILFGDLQGYRIVDRVGLTTLRDPFTLAAVGQTRLHARKRTGGDVTHPDRFIKLTVA